MADPAQFHYLAGSAEELKLLSLPAPSKVNFEDFEDDLIIARVISKDAMHEDELKNKALGRSNLRKNVATLLEDVDSRYAGETVSREDLLKLRGDVVNDDDLSEDDLTEDGSEPDSELENKQELEAIMDESHEFYGSWSDKSGSEEWDESEEEGLEDGTKDGGEVEESRDWDEDGEQERTEGEKEDKKEMQQFSQSGKDEVEKGKAVVHQIALWDSLLESRIRLQKMLVEVNKLPQREVLSGMKDSAGSQIKYPLNNAQQLLTNLLHNLLILQQTLYERNTELAGILNGENKMAAEDSDENIPSDDENDQDGGKDGGSEGNKDKDDGQDTLKLSMKRKPSMHLDEYSNHIAKRHAAFEHFRDATIKKWNEKTRLASGKVNSKSFNSFDRSTLHQIKQILNDRERLIKRTQLKRSSYRVLGKMEGNENKNSVEQRDVHLKDYDAEIFDDDDFYHQLLREFIERKSNVDPNDPIAMGRQWLEIQRLRNKVKRKVDTKASKGRRLRYDVHTKLVSFMAPYNRGTMPDSSRNELFSSLFGKRQPQETGDIPVDLFR